MSTQSLSERTATVLKNSPPAVDDLAADLSKVSTLAAAIKVCEELLTAPNIKYLTWFATNINCEFRIDVCLMILRALIPSSENGGKLFVSRMSNFVSKKKLLKGLMSESNTFTLGEVKAIASLLI